MELENLTDPTKAAIAKLDEIEEGLAVSSRANDLDHLNRMHEVAFRLDESCMNVGWDGVPGDAHVAQLLRDATDASDLIRAIEEKLAAKIGAKWSGDGKRFYLPEGPEAE